MPKYIVNVREVHIQPYEVTARSKEGAIKKALDEGKIIEGGFEYSHTLGTETWTVKEDTE